MAKKEKVTKTYAWIEIGGDWYLVRDGERYWVSQSRVISSPGSTAPTFTEDDVKELDKLFKTGD